MKMRFLFLFTLAFACVGHAQSVADGALQRYIEVTGTGEIEIVPDEIFVTITLQESREKESIGKQEEALRQQLKELGIDASKLSVNSADADYGRMRSFRKEVIVTKTYILKIGDAAMLSKVYERLDKINAHDAYVSHAGHSRMAEYTKEARVKAIRAAKEKAEYLLVALGQHAGAPLQIHETENQVFNPLGRAANMRKLAANSMMQVEDEQESDLSFRKIRIRSGYMVKFEIR